MNPRYLDIKSKKIIAKVTAAIAGREKCVAEWRTARDLTGRIEILLTHLKNLGAARCASSLDERLASLRTKRHLSGPSAKNEVTMKLESGLDIEGMCWRNASDVRDANNASMRNLRKGLSVARTKVMQKREKVLAGLPGKEASFLKLGIQILTDQTKGKEIAGPLVWKVEEAGTSHNSP